MRYYICEEGDAEMGYTWDLFQEDGDKIVRVGSFFAEAFAQRSLDALKWLEAFDQGMVSIPKKKASNRHTTRQLPKKKAPKKP